MIVVDASVVVELLLNNPEAIAVKRRTLDISEELHAPHLLDIEVTHVFRRYALMGAVSPRHADEAVTALIDFPLQRHSHDVLLSRIWALRNNLTAYDATYVALAELLDAPLLTCDQRFARSSNHHAAIELV